MINTEDQFETIESYIGEFRENPDKVKEYGTFFLTCEFGDFRICGFCVDLERESGSVSKDTLRMMAELLKSFYAANSISRFVEATSPTFMLNYINCPENLTKEFLIWYVMGRPRMSQLGELAVYARKIQSLYRGGFNIEPITIDGEYNEKPRKYLIGIKYVFYDKQANTSTHLYS